MSRVLFSVWFTIQGIIQNMTCSVWFRSQRVIQKCPVYYSASSSVFRVFFFKIRPAASGSGFSVLLKNVQYITQRVVHDLGYFSKYDLQRVVQDSGYYSASGSRFKVLFKIRPAASGSGFSVLLKDVQCITQRVVHDSWYF